MNRTPTLPRPQGTVLVIAVVLSTTIAVGILISVAELFQSRGDPLGQLAAAERACAGNMYVSDRESCMRDWIAATQGQNLAKK